MSRAGLDAAQDSEHGWPALARALSLFRSEYGRDPTHGAVAPGRVNLIGEHTDYSGGFVLPIAIEHACVCLAAPAADPGVTRLISVDVPSRDESLGRVDIRRPLIPPMQGAGASMPAGAWTAYAAGVMETIACLRPGARVNLDIAIASDVPLGGGLSSSASLEAAVATLVNDLHQLELAPEALAAQCRMAEHQFAGVPCGIMDQFISLMGRTGHALLIDCESERARPVPMPAEAAVLIVNSGVRHALGETEYPLRRETCAHAAAVLGIPSLRHATVAQVRGCAGLSAIERQRALHVVTENQRTLDAADALARAELPRMGELMRESHVSLRDSYNVSCRELDVLVESACAAPGVYGARMTGGGFGGCIVALVRPEQVERAAERVILSYREVLGREATAFVTRAGPGARALRPGEWDRPR